MTGGFSFLLILLKKLYSKSPTCLRSWLLVFFSLKGQDCDCCGRGKVRTSVKSIDGIDIYLYFCLAFTLPWTYIWSQGTGGCSQRLDSAHQVGRSEAFKRLRSWEADLSAFRPHSVRKTPEKGIPSPYEAFPQVHADKAEKRANFGTFR
jgi:hypothetical protein